MAKKTSGVTTRASKAEASVKEAAAKADKVARKNAVKADKAAKAKVKALKADLASAGRQVASLRSAVETLESRLEKAEAKSKKWKTEARQGRTRIAKLEAKLRRTRRDAPVDHEPPADRGDLPLESDDLDAEPTTAPREEPTSSSPSTPSDATSAEELAGTPDATWTVAQLRAVARERGVTGASRMTKARLVEALS